MPKPPEKPKAGAGKPTKAQPAGKAKGAAPAKGAPPPAKAPTKAGGGKGAPAKAAPANTPPTEEPLEEKSMYHYEESPSEKKTCSFGHFRWGEGMALILTVTFPKNWVFGGRFPIRYILNDIIANPIATFFLPNLSFSLSFQQC